MTEERLPLAELSAQAGGGAFLRPVAEVMVQLLMETDVDGVIGAGRHERSLDETPRLNDLTQARQPNRPGRIAEMPGGDALDL
jgi:hypothetical protein